MEIPQNVVFYYCTNKISWGYIKAIVDGQEFHIRLSYITKIFGLPNEGDYSYFDNVKTIIFLENNILKDELVGTVLDKEQASTTH